MVGENLGLPTNFTSRIGDRVLNKRTPPQATGYLEEGLFLFETPRFLNLSSLFGNSLASNGE